MEIDCYTHLSISLPASVPSPSSNFNLQKALKLLFVGAIVLPLSTTTSVCSTGSSPNKNNEWLEYCITNPNLLVQECTKEATKKRGESAGGSLTDKNSKSWSCLKHLRSEEETREHSLFCLSLESIGAIRPSVLIKNTAEEALECCCACGCESCTKLSYQSKPRDEPTPFD